MHKNKNGSNHWLRWVITAAFLGLAVYVLVRNADVLSKSITALRGAEPGMVFLAVALTFAMFLAAAKMYQQLALKKLRFGQTAVVEFAAAAVNRLLPGGVGSLGVHGLYLYRKGHSTAQATAVVAINNLLGIAVHLSLLTLLFLFKPTIVEEFELPAFGNAQFIAVTSIAILVCYLFLVPKWRKFVADFARNILVSLRFYGKHRQRLVVATLLAVLVSALYTTVLYVVAHALGLSIGFLPCFVVFSVSVLAATATPTPGGLVGAEAGLFAGFTAYGFTAEQALSVTLLFRFITYWLPILPGLCLLFVARRQKLL